ncbi:uncharacterized protein Z518_00898 [Rhinocladiella mackenziei CBS 650.93]|uniref:Aldehyde dehydrogenase domain-containing protein n=1 Tax=Rhinocladiella mackenziei CBS 650.93 TaxID=1442369 RepID=A0A0D2G4Z5_9EURO|nr:uncharacterized protein Z518_00898 [Rhinocladiella mackenziei CBS 650.93]KIX09817.1 hypothetical protein Z518_00898 [Rhinocladiella mackenziei CBS 650.93]
MAPKACNSALEAIRTWKWIPGTARREIPSQGCRYNLGKKRRMTERDSRSFTFPRALIEYQLHVIVQALFDAEARISATPIVQTARKDAPAVREALISYPTILKVEFRGSRAVSRIIGSLAGKYVERLGDANLEDAAVKCVFGAYNHHGQVCFSTERNYVIRSVADRFMECSRQKRRSSRLGVPILKDSPSKLKPSRSKGAKFVFGSSTFKD